MEKAPRNMDIAPPSEEENTRDPQFPRKAPKENPERKSSRNRIKALTTARNKGPRPNLGKRNLNSIKTIAKKS